MPVKRLFWSVLFWRLVTRQRCQIRYCTYNDAKFWKFAKVEGIVPSRLLLSNDSRFNEMRLPSSFGIVPSNALLSNCSCCNDCMFDIDDGIGPLKLFEFNLLREEKCENDFPNLVMQVTYNVVRYWRDVKDCGKVPKNLLNWRSISFSCKNDSKKSGRFPSSLLLPAALVAWSQLKAGINNQLMVYTYNETKFPNAEKDDGISPMKLLLLKSLIDNWC